jgi:hypothetical protein
MRVELPSENKLTLTRGVVMVKFESKDPGAVTDWIEWEIANGIFPIKGTCYSGLGRFGASYRSEDAEAVLARLRNMFPEFHIS